MCVQTRRACQWMMGFILKRLARSHYGLFMFQINLDRHDKELSNHSGKKQSHNASKVSGMLPATRAVTPAAEVAAHLKHNSHTYSRCFSLTEQTSLKASLPCTYYTKTLLYPSRSNFEREWERPDFKQVQFLYPTKAYKDTQQLSLWVSDT